MDFSIDIYFVFREVKEEIGSFNKKLGFICGQSNNLTFFLKKKQGRESFCCFVQNLEPLDQIWG